MQAANPGFNPARAVEPAYVRLPPDVESGSLIEEPLTAQVADLCNGLYELILQVLTRYYVHEGETPAELETLARTAKHLMNWVMRQLCPVLTTLPIGATHPGRTAGPTLEVARPAYFVLPHRQPAWLIMSERLGILTETCAAARPAAGSRRAERSRGKTGFDDGRHPCPPVGARPSLRAGLGASSRVVASPSGAVVGRSGHSSGVPPSAVAARAAQGPAPGRHGHSCSPSRTSRSRPPAVTAGRSPAAWGRSCSQ